MKDTVNKAIVQRIVETSLQLASSKSLPGPVENTYNSMEEASAKLPKSFQSWPVFWMSGGPFHIPIGNMEIETVNWEMMDPKDPVDWKKQIRLKKED